MANKRDRTIGYFRHICTLAVAMAAFTLTIFTAVPGRSFVREDLLQMGMMLVLGAALAAFIAQTLCVFFCDTFTGSFRLGYSGGLWGMASATALVAGIWTLMQFVLLNLPVHSETSAYSASEPQAAAEEARE